MSTTVKVIVQINDGPKVVVGKVSMNGSEQRNRADLAGLLREIAREFEEGER